MPYSKWLKQQKFISYISRRKVQDQGTSKFCIWWKPTSWFIDGGFSCVLTWQIRELSQVPFLRAVIPFMRTHPHGLMFSQRSHFQISLLWGWDFNIWILRRHIQSIAHGVGTQSVSPGLDWNSWWIISTELWLVKGVLIKTIEIKEDLCTLPLFLPFSHLYI